MLKSFLQARRRSLAATVIQRAFRAWINRFTDLIYIHIKCASTSEADELYRVALADALAAINVRLRWTDFDGFRTGHSSRLGKMARSRAGKRDYVVLGSHGSVKSLPPLAPSSGTTDVRVLVGFRLLGMTGFFVTGERRSDDAMCVHPVPVVTKRFREIWPDAHLFVDACYSTAGLGDDADFDGHAGNPLYEDAIDRIAIWVETLILQQSARVFLE